jgi:hypothetical protein
MVEQAITDMARKIDSRAPALARDAADYLGGALGIAHRDDRRAHQTAGIGGAVVGKPSMVRVDHRDFEIDGLQRAEARHDGREEHRHVDALAIHILDADMRIAAAAHIGMLGTWITSGADQRLIGMGHAERPAGVELMEETEKEL